MKCKMMMSLLITTLIISTVFASGTNLVASNSFTKGTAGKSITFCTKEVFYPWSTNIGSITIEVSGESITKFHGETLDLPAGTYPITANPPDGWVFSIWESEQPSSIYFDVDGTWPYDYTHNPCKITIVDNLLTSGKIWAVFAEIRTITTEVNPVGSGYVEISPPDGPYADATYVNFTACPDQGWYFDYWSGNYINGNRENPLTHCQIDRDIVMIANFKPIPPDSNLTVTVDPTGSGTVSLDPTGGTYAFRTKVTLTAHPSQDWYFDYWSGDINVKGNPVATIEMDKNKNVTAHFTQNPTYYTLTVNIKGNGDVSLDPNGGKYLYGSTVKLYPKASEGWYFNCWDGDLSGESDPGTIFMDSDKSVTAYFGQKMGRLVVQLTLYRSTPKNADSLYQYVNVSNDETKEFFESDHKDTKMCWYPYSIPVGDYTIKAKLGKFSEKTVNVHVKDLDEEETLVVINFGIGDETSRSRTINSLFSNFLAKLFDSNPIIFRMFRAIP